MAEDPSRADTLPDTDRRTAERHPSDLITSCHPLALPRTEAVAARVKDVAAGGVALVIRYGFEPGTVLVIDLDGTADGTSPPLLARVVHTEPGADGRWVLGCTLKRQLTPEQLQMCRAASGAPAVVRPAGPERAWGGGR